MIVYVSVTNANTERINPMTYLESAEEVTISKSRAFKEICDHGLKEDWQDFLMYAITLESTKVDREGYIVEMEATTVLHWLGY
jgi:hypothetical protein